MRLVMCFVCALLCACAGQRAPLTAKPAPPPATQPSGLALLTLDEILPQPVLGQPTTAPSARPSIAALELFARAKDAQIRGLRTTEVDLLRQAIEQDPHSFALNYALAVAYIGSGIGNDLAIRQFERAAEIQPDSLDAQLQLGRQHLARNNLDQAIYRLRLALLTSDYKTDDEQAALVNLFLARALQQKGYDRAALEQYQTLMDRMAGRLAFRGHPELYFLLTHPEMVYINVGQLSEKLGNYADAMKAYELASEREPNNFSFRAHRVRLMLLMGQFDQAKTTAAELVSDYRASAESVQLLKEVFQQMGREDKLVDELRGILKRKPADRAITFALAETLATSGRPEQAEKILRDLLPATGWDLAVAARLFDFYIAQNRAPDATRLLMETLAQRPDSAEDLEPMWMKLMRLTGPQRLRFADVQQLQVPRAAAASRLYWTAKLATIFGRRATAQHLLEQAVAIEPALPAAYFDLLDAHLFRSDAPEAERQAAVRKLIERARQHQHAALADELNGISLLGDKKYDQAVAAFDQAIAQSKPSSRLSYLKAVAMIRAGGKDKAEAILWQIVTENPTYDRAYEALFQIYQASRDIRQIDRVMRNWLIACPTSLLGRRHQVEVLVAQRRLRDAETVALEIFRDESDDPRAIELLREFYALQNRTADFLDKLEEARRNRPDNRVLVAHLAALYKSRGQTDKAVRVLDEMRQAVVGDVDQLYFLADLYQQLDRKELAESVLLDALKVDGAYAPANNYLGYMWADDGKNLAQAEAMVRLAVSAEPNNVAYLDSLGWVLYKRGQFQEAEQHLADALKSMDEPDPIMLDHLGDARYRLNRNDDAYKAWQQAMERLNQSAADRDELTRLKVQLKEKLERCKSGQPVNVAPVVETVTSQAH